MQIPIRHKKMLNIFTYQENVRKPKRNVILHPLKRLKLKELMIP